ncbi:restriction endonuclease, partial [Streptomyces populi]
MAVPARARRTARRSRRFELRATALYFALLAVIIALVGAAARTAAAVRCTVPPGLRRSPSWASAPPWPAAAGSAAYRR